MSVARVTEIISSSKKSFEDAIEKGINRAAKTLIRCKRLRRTPLRARARGRVRHGTRGGDFRNLKLIARVGGQDLSPSAAGQPAAQAADRRRV
jgi:flavin-binding protein dodecin